MHKFCKEIFANYLHTTRQKKFPHFYFFLIRLFKIFHFFCIFEIAWSRAFQKCILYHVLDIFFCKHFHYVTEFCNQNLNFCKFAIFFADFQSRASELSNDVFFVILRVDNFLKSWARKISVVITGVFFEFWHKLKISKPISIKPDGVNLWYFKLRILYLIEFIVWNIGLQTYWDKKNQGLWQKLSFFKLIRPKG